MNTKQADDQAMSKATMKYMDDNSTVYTGNTKITGLVADIKVCNTTIDDQAAIQSQNTTGATITQNIKWEDAAEKSAKLSTGLKAYFIDIDDQTHYKLVDYTVSDFLRGKKVAALARMNTVHDIAAGITIGLLADFGIVASDVTDAATAITLFNNAEPVKRNMVEVTSTATKIIAEQVKIRRTKFKKLDLLVNVMSDSHPDFVTGYHTVRKKIDVGKGHKTEIVEMTTNSIRTIFYNKFEVGYSFLVRNNSDVEILVGLSSGKNLAPETDLIKVEAQTELVVKLPKSARGFTSRYFSIVNQSKIYKAHVVVIMSKSASTSGAGEVELSGIPK